MDKQQQLLEVKRKIITNLVPLVIDGEGEPAERADAVLSMIDFGNAAPELYEKGLEIITQIDDDTVKRDFLLRLLGSLQLDLGADTTEPAVEQTEAEAPAEAQSYGEQNDQPDQNEHTEEYHQE